MQQRSLMVSLLLVGALGVIYFAARFLVATTDKPLVTWVEAHRTNLVLVAGRWHLTGQTNAFTGFLVETYEAGARRSCSAVSNGWLQGGRLVGIRTDSSRWRSFLRPAPPTA